MKTNKYRINYGLGLAILYTPYECNDRFYTLAGTCFGIRKNILCCNVISKEEVECDDFESLEFNGDVYVWDKDGRRKMIESDEDNDWDDYYCEKCKYVEP